MEPCILCPSAGQAFLQVCPHTLWGRGYIYENYIPCTFLITPSSAFSKDVRGLLRDGTMTKGFMIWEVIVVILKKCPKQATWLMPAPNTSVLLRKGPQVPPGVQVQVHHFVKWGPESVRENSAYPLPCLKTSLGSSCVAFPLPQGRFLFYSDSFRDESVHGSLDSSLIRTEVVFLT